MYAVQTKHTQNGFSIKNLVNKSKGQKNTRYLQNKQYSKLNSDYMIVIQEIKIV